MASVIGVVIALLAIFVIMVVVLLYAYKRQKMCFKGKIGVTIFFLCFPYCAVAAEPRLIERMFSTYVSSKCVSCP